jgi:hypothetical protein
LKGIGAQLLAALREIDEPCYCVPYAHLEAFYARAGFVLIEEGFPDFLRARAVDYRAKGLSVPVMKRKPLAGAAEQDVCARS